jgi:hypothetical protein
VLPDNPLLTLLGRRGRGAVAETLLRAPQRTWSVRDLARFADVAPMVASRTVRELAALGAVEVLRPGRDARIRLRFGSPAARWLAASGAPDLHGEAAAAFATAYGAVPGVTRLLRWRHPDDEPADPLAPLRIALVTARSPEAALDAAGPGLDALAREGWPAPEVTAWRPADLRGEDPVARAIAAGIPL